MDHGTLTDNNGRKVDFRNVLVMTTNAGVQETVRKSIGLDSKITAMMPCLKLTKSLVPSLEIVLMALFGLTWMKRSSYKWSINS